MSRQLLSHMISLSKKKKNISVADFKLNVIKEETTNPKTNSDNGGTRRGMSHSK